MRLLAGNDDALVPWIVSGSLLLPCLLSDSRTLAFASAALGLDVIVLTIEEEEIEKLPIGFDATGCSGRFDPPGELIRPVGPELRAFPSKCLLARELN